MFDIERKEMLALLEPAQTSAEEKELRAWLKQCRTTLADRNSLEVAAMAILCGFERTLVYAVVSCFRDAMAGTHVEKRAAFQTWHFEQAVKEVQEMKTGKEMNLRPLWESVCNYQTEGL